MTDHDRVARRVVVHGRVQGVFFRDTCRREAQARGVTGWVSNRYDDTVEAVFEGPTEAVDAMVTWARTGPRAADIERLDVTDVDAAGLGEFQVR